jgi:hypothetical protein
MADEQDEAPQVEDEVLELTDEVETPQDSEEAETPPEADDEEIVVSFGDEEAPPASSEQENSTIREMRKALREKEAQLKELEKKVAPQEIEVGQKPTLESCEYDEERFEQEFNAYLDRKSSAEAAKSEAQKAQEETAKRYQAKVETYAAQKTELGVKDFDNAEAEVLGTLNQAQQAILVHGAQNKALLVYALGRSPEKLRQLASIADPIEFAFAAARLEGQTKMERKRPATNPESRVSGAAQLSPAGGKLSDRLSTEEWARRRNEQIREARRR